MYNSDFSSNNHHYATIYSRAEIYKAIGDVLSELGLYKKAILNYNLAIELNPDYMDAYDCRENARSFILIQQEEDMTIFNATITHYIIEHDNNAPDPMNLAGDFEDEAND